MTVVGPGRGPLDEAGQAVSAVGAAPLRGISTVDGMRRLNVRLVAGLLVLLLAAAACGDDAGTAPAAGVEEPPGPDLAAARALPALGGQPAVEGRGRGRIVDADGREVVLRGVNVNALAEYWSGNEFDTVFPLTDDDIARMEAIGWNAVRLLVSWSRVEPEPGEYDEAYLNEVDDAVDRLAARGLYTIVDLHQDAWGATLAARDDEGCASGTQPAIGWDGAPGWATRGGDEPGTRCTIDGSRETSAAVLASFDAFWNDAPGPDGTGIRTRYAAMIGHLAARWADRPEIAGYDVMNEPNAYGDTGTAGLTDLYAEAIAAVREAEEAADGAFGHLVLVEPSIIWSGTGEGRPADLPDDPDLVYAPHLYEGGFDGSEITEDAFADAHADAAALGGLPVLSGEWGADPRRAGPDGDGYFVEHQRLQDQTGTSATLWTWRESCGDPHKIGEDDPYVWGEFDVDCTTNEVLGPRDDLIADLTRARVQAAPGRLDTTGWDSAAGLFEVSGSGAETGATLVAFVPDRLREATLEVSGLTEPTVVPIPDGGAYLLADTTAADWSLTVTSG